MRFSLRRISPGQSGALQNTQVPHSESRVDELELFVLSCWVARELRHVFEWIYNLSNGTLSDSHEFAQMGNTHATSEDLRIRYHPQNGMHEGVVEHSSHPDVLGDHLRRNSKRGARACHEQAAGERDLAPYSFKLGNRIRTNPAESNPLMHAVLLGTPLSKCVPRYSIGTERPPELGRLVENVNGVDS